MQQMEPFLTKSQKLSNDETAQKEDSLIIKNKSALQSSLKNEVTSMQEEILPVKGSNFKIDKNIPTFTSIQIESQSLVQKSAIANVIPAIETNQCESNLSNGNGRESLKEIKPISKETTSKIIAVGNPGAGKSTILNSLAEEVLFKSGVSVGKGMTYKLDQAENKNGHFLDTPGLADEELRKKAGEAISEGLRKGGSYKVVFFVTQESGRVNHQDATTLKLVLEAAPDIQNEYGIIVNKVSKGALKTFKEESLKFDFLNTLFAGIPEERRCVYSNVRFFGRISNLEDEKDTLISPNELKDDSDLSLNDFVHDWIPTVAISDTNVADIDIELFDETTKKMESMAQQLQEKDEQWKEERRQLEAQRIKENEETRRMVMELENLRKIDAEESKRQIKELEDQRIKDSEESRKLQEETEQEMRTLLEQQMYDLLEKQREELEVKKKEEWEALEDQRRRDIEENQKKEIEMNIKLEQLKKGQEINEQNRQSEIKALEDQMQILQSEEKNQLKSQDAHPAASKRFGSWLKSWIGNQSELIMEEELNWSKPHELMYDSVLRKKQIATLRNSFGPDLKICHYATNLAKITYDQYFVTDGAGIMEFGSGDLQVKYC